MPALRFALVVFALASISSVVEGALAITSPAPNATLQGTIRLTVSSEGVATGARIGFLLNGRPLYDKGDPVRQIPKERGAIDWNSANVFDGTHQLEAVARDASDKILEISAPVPVRILNSGTSVTLVSPDPKTLLKGTFEWKIRIQQQRKPAGNYLWKFFVDGEPYRDPLFTDRSEVSLQIDSAKLRNGPHELMCGVYLESAPRPPVGMSQVRVRTENGRLPLELRASYQSLYLRPSQTETVTARLIHTDGSEVPVSAAFLSTAPTIATVSPAGLVKAVARGSAFINVLYRGLTRRIEVNVRSPPGFPHFTTSGKIVTRFGSGSHFLRTLFSLDPSELEETPGLSKALHDASVTALTTGLYLNPADGSPSDIAEWKRSFDGHMDQLVSASKQANLQVFFSGDDLARTPEELADTVSAASAERVRYAFTRARDLRNVIGIDMIDEVDFLWGDRPDPTDGRWRSRKPPIPGDAFVRFMALVNSVPGRPAISWPVSGLAKPESVRNWQLSPTYSDFATIFWTTMDAPAFPEGFSLPQIRTDLGRVLDQRQALLAERQIPQLLLVSGSGPFYDKAVSGNQFTPGKDHMRQAGDTGMNMQAEMMLAISRGMCGVRLYSFDTRERKSVRELAAAGTQELETGIDPFVVGVERWKAASLAFNLIHRLEPVILQQNIHAPDLGSRLYTGAKDGPNGRMLLVTSFSELAEPASVDLKPYAYGGGSVKRYTLTVRSVQETSISGDSDKITLEPGSTAIYVFSSSARIRN